MNDFLTLNKILKDSVALLRAHFLYIVILISAAVIPYTLIVRMENLPDWVIFIIPLFILIMMAVEIVSVRLVSSSYVDLEFNITDQLIKALAIVLPYTLITLIAVMATFMGISVLVIPGIFATIFFNMLKVDFIINRGTIRERVRSTVELFDSGSFFKIAKIYILPFAIQLASAFILTSNMNPDNLETNIEALYPYITVAIIVIFPISICFRVAIYFNNLKYRHKLKSTNQLV